MALQTYSKGTLLMSGIVLAELMNFTVDHKSGNNPIHTVEKGFAGISPGSASVEIKFESAVPKVGVDFDYLDAQKNQTILDIVYFARGKKCKTKGFIMETTEQYGADKPASFGGTLMCGPVEESTLLWPLRGGSHPRRWQRFWRAGGRLSWRSISLDTTTKATRSRVYIFDCSRLPKSRSRWLRLAQTASG